MLFSTLGAVSYELDRRPSESWKGECCPPRPVTLASAFRSGLPGDGRGSGADRLPAPSPAHAWASCSSPARAPWL